MENKARADVARVFGNEADLRTVMENKCFDIFELAEYVRKLEGRLEAVSGVVSDSIVWNDPIPALAIMEAVRG